MQGVLVATDQRPAPKTTLWLRSVCSSGTSGNDYQITF